MPIFDWTRSSLDHEFEDGSTALIFEEEIVKKMDPLTVNYLYQAGIAAIKKKSFTNII